MCGSRLDWNLEDRLFCVELFVIEENGLLRCCERLAFRFEKCRFCMWGLAAGRTGILGDKMPWLIFEYSRKGGICFPSGDNIAHAVIWLRFGLVCTWFALGINERFSFAVLWMEGGLRFMSSGCYELLVDL